MEAALLLCDLRGFTELSNRLPGSTVLGLLNAYFDKIVLSHHPRRRRGAEIHGRRRACLFPGL